MRRWEAANSKYATTTKGGTHNLSVIVIMSEIAASDRETNDERSENCPR